MTTLSHCNTGRTCLTLPITTRENTSLAIHVQKITIIRKIRGLKFDTLYTGAVWRRREKFEYGCTTTYYHPYQKPLKYFFRIERLNRLSVRTNIGPTVHFWYHRYELESFSWHPVMS